MNNRLEQYAEDLHQEILAESSDQATPRMREEAFTQFMLELLSEHNEADDAEVCYYEAKSAGRVPAAKLNGWALSGDGATLDLFVTLYFGSGKVEEVGKPDVRRSFQLLRGFLKRAHQGLHTQLEESSDAFQAMQQIYTARETLATVRLFFLTDGVVRSLELEQETIPGLDVRYVVWDLDKLSRLRVGERQVIELDFANRYDGAIPCLQIQDPTGEYQTYLAFMPAPLLARIYGEYGQRLLERNVRAFLQVKGTVNRGLQKTLREEPHRFLAYNNGLCCTAAEVRVEAVTNVQGCLEWVRDFQIVNGGQTTASIYHAIKKEKLNVSQVVVQVKLTVLKDAEKVPEIVPLISRYANSQNKINAADFSANGPFHHLLEQVSRMIWAPAMSGLERGTHWYYERARGCYADDKARQGTLAKRREWEAQNPPRQKFTKTDLAKFENAWMGLPHLVCLGAEKNFVRFAEQMEEEGELVVDENYFKQAVAKAILWRAAEKLFDSLELQGYRANSVAYAIAWLAEQTERKLDLEHVWREQRLSAELSNALKAACAAAHKHICTQAGNPGEASKRELCWNAFRKTALSPSGIWQNGLTSLIIPAGKLAANQEENALITSWERVRQDFIHDPRTVAELESLTGKNWVVIRRDDPIHIYAEKSWIQLRGMRGLGARKIGGLIEILTIARNQ
ncbi:MAG: AIPR family protein [Acidobacteria bacterium]|nr:AIPR family protein [Acidobacteriota bacterium]MBI3421720.1 AIPR family protein [Acidobacteriota bacterium]